MKRKNILITFITLLPFLACSCVTAASNDRYQEKLELREIALENEIKRQNEIRGEIEKMDEIYKNSKKTGGDIIIDTAIGFGTAAAADIFWTWLLGGSGD